MPLEKALRDPVEAQWEFTVVDMERRLIAFKDLSYGEIDSWRWDFGDGKISTEQHPIHKYEEAGTSYTVTLYVEGPEGKARMSKVWDVIVR
ncbi:MAG: PKD domain-containing protein, partial [Gemmatimonadetes bacterium]|nr:PKD domain-containing protein [Gemmatimonadota bacterium]